MPLMDEDGFILGRVNIIDVLVILLVVAVVVAGVAFVTADEAEQPTRTIVLDAGEQPDHVIDAIEEGDVPTGDVDSVDAIEASETDDTTYELVLTLTVPVSEDVDGQPEWNDERLYVDRSIEVDLGQTIVEGVVIDMAE